MEQITQGRIQTKMEDIIYEDPVIDEEITTDTISESLKEQLQKLNPENFDSKKENIKKCLICGWAGKTLRHIFICPNCKGRKMKFIAANNAAEDWLDSTYHKKRVLLEEINQIFVKDKVSDFEYNEIKHDVSNLIRKMGDL
jgi:hypothetical protein